MAHSFQAVGNAFAHFPLFLHQIVIDMTDLTLILTVALAAAFLLIVAGLLFFIVYYRWRLMDSHRTLARFIRENILLHDKLEQTTNQRITDY